MNKFNEFKNFMDFLIEHKWPKMMKSKSDNELLNLYDTYSPEYFSPTSIRTHIYGSIAVYCVVEELKKRYPKSATLSNYQYDKPINLHNYIKGE